MDSQKSPQAGDSPQLDNEKTEVPSSSPYPAGVQTWASMRARLFPRLPIRKRSYGITHRCQGEKDACRPRPWRGRRTTRSGAVTGAQPRRSRPKLLPRGLKEKPGKLLCTELPLSRALVLPIWPLLSLPRAGLAEPKLLVPTEW